VVTNPDLASLPEGVGVVSREIAFHNDDFYSVGEANDPTLESPLAHADNSRGMRASRIDHLYNMEVEESNESTGVSEIENPQFNSLVDSPSIARVTIQACQSDSLYEKYGNPMTRIEVMMDPVNLISLTSACETVGFTKAVRTGTQIYADDLELSHNSMKLPCYITLKQKVEFVALTFIFASSTFYLFQSNSRSVTASRRNAALSIEGPP
jgi:hypothetical protein